MTGERANNELDMTKEGKSPRICQSKSRQQEVLTIFFTCKAESFSFNLLKLDLTSINR